MQHGLCNMFMQRVQASMQDKHANQWKDGLINELGNSNSPKISGQNAKSRGPNTHAHMHKLRHQHLSTIKQLLNTSKRHKHGLLAYMKSSEIHAKHGAKPTNKASQTRHTNGPSIKASQ